ncbi:hypothetical protein A3734_04380 [Sulfitobacter sp. HI0054]|nr:hypothetical protein A3734_04380 [Sulfitobacter sp. HI0054]
MSSTLSLKVFQHILVQYGIGQQALKLGILVLQRPLSDSLGHIHTATLGLQLVCRSSDTQIAFPIMICANSPLGLLRVFRHALKNRRKPILAQLFAWRHTVITPRC